MRKSGNKVAFRINYEHKKEERIMQVSMYNSKRNTLLFIAFFLLAGLLHTVEHMIHDISASGDPHYEIVTLFFCMELVIYTVLIIFWIQSVYIRLLPSRARNYMVIVALLMIFYLLLRTYKYRIGETDAGIRFSWYAYYIPMTFIPSLFLMVCICIQRGFVKTKPEEQLFLIPAVVLSGLIITNDLHHIVFVPDQDIADFIGKSGTYTYGITFYITYAWIGSAILIGIILLIKTFGLKQKRNLMYLGGILVVWLILLLSHNLKNHIEFSPPFEAPEIHIFTMLAIFEFSIRQRLIPNNENYAGFFASLPMTVMITDRKFAPVYRSVCSLNLEPDVLAKALETPIYPIPDGKLSGRKIRGGYTFWIEDESDIRHANEQLSEVNELLESENNLIEYENRQKEENAYLRLHHHIYHEIAQEMYPYQKKIEDILNEIKPGTKDFIDHIAEVSVLNVFVKRKTNLLLMASEHETIDINELLLAISESGKYLKFVGLKTSVDDSGFHIRCHDMPDEVTPDYPSNTVIALYDTFQLLAEQLMHHATLLMISYNDEGLRLAADTDRNLNTESAPLPVSTEQQDDILYINIKVLPAQKRHNRISASIQEKPDWQKGGE